MKSLLGQVLPVLSLLSLLFFACFPATPVHGVVKIDSELRKLMSEDESTGYIIHFKSKLSLKKAYAMEWKARGRFVADTLRDTANESQAGVKAYLKDRNALYKSFWVGNMIVVEASDLATLNGLEDFPEIDRIARRPRIVLHEPVKKRAAALQTSNVQTNISHVKADQVWTTLGIKGSGVTVANIDTGVRYTHQALVNQYRGNSGGAYNHNYNWWDPYGDHPTEPGDDHGHGSHTMGIMVGSDGGSNQTGMAPEARWIACRGFQASSGSDVALLECAQWVIAPWDLSKSSPDPDLRPQVVNNSWGDCSQTYDDWFQAAVDAWHAAGIYPVFSNGNAGNCARLPPPGCNTVGNPARYGNVTGVGATGNSDGQYAAFSTWGATDNLDMVNPGGYPYLKPQVVAPGDSITSAYNAGDDGYVSMSGTSMAAPHVGGLVGLMLSACPGLSEKYGVVETIIQKTAVRIPYASNCGGEGPDNVPNNATGWGEIDALGAVRSAADICISGTVTGTVRDARTRKPIADANVTADGSAAVTDASGEFKLEFVGEGSQTVKASSHGYYDQATVATVIRGGATAVDFSLKAKVMTTLTGKVTDGSGGKWPLYATLAATNNNATITASTNISTGAYTMKVYRDTDYVFHISSAGYAASETLVTTTGRFSPRNFSLMAGPDCSAPGYTLSGGACAAQSGSLVMGFLRDANTKSLLPGFVVNSISGSARSDAGGKYIVFSPAGKNPLVANPSALLNYGVLTKWVTVGAGKIVASDLYLPAALLKGPKKVSVTVAQGATKKAKLTLQNTGGVSTSFALTADAAWLGISPASGTLEAKKSESMTLTFDAADMSAGTYDAVITVSGVTPYSSPSIAATMKVTAGKGGTSGEEVNIENE